MIIGRGFTDAERPLVSQLYWSAFGPKLNRVLGPSDRAERFLSDVIDPTHAITARSAEGRLLGLAGFKTFKGAFVGGDFADMARHYGHLGALWRAALLALLERDVENQRFLMDGIFVAPDARGQGVGTALLDAVAYEALKQGHTEVRLDVIDSNPRARALYEREGFVAGGVQRLGLLRHVFGFESATTMIRRVG